jgi:hypothetical protein
MTRMPSSDLRVSAGHVALELRAPGFETLRRELDVDGGQTEQLTLTLVPVSETPTLREKAYTPPPSGGISDQKVLALTTGAIGLVGAVVGTVSGLTAASKKSDAEKVCPGLCPSQNGVQLWSDARTAGNVSTIAFVVAGVGLTGAAVLWLSAKPAAGRTARAAEIDLGLGSVQVRGRW